MLNETMTTSPIKVMREKIDAKSEAQGFPESRLPSFTEEESAMILGSSDFLGMNFYTAQVAFSSALLISSFWIHLSITRLSILRQATQKWLTTMQVGIPLLINAFHCYPWTPF